MATLIAAYNSEGCIGRCDAKCYKATEPSCTCICGGMNHGAGLATAIDNTQALYEEWIDQYKALHPDATEFEVPALEPIQLDMFNLLEV